MKTLITLALSALISVQAFAISPVPEKCNTYMNDFVPWVELQNDTSKRCKYDLKVYGRKGVTKDNCQTLVNKLNRKVEINEHCEIIWQQIYFIRNGGPNEFKRVKGLLNDTGANIRYLNQYMEANK